MKTKEEQRQFYREQAKINGESVSIQTVEKKTYVKCGKKKSNRGAFLKGVKNLYG